jgi:hypothetical protein
MKNKELDEKHKKELCEAICKIAKLIFKATDLCQITEKGCRRHTFASNPQLCCRHCEHLETGKGCKVLSPSCACGGCYQGWITAEGVDPEAVSFFGKENEETLYLLSLLRWMMAGYIPHLTIYGRLSVDELFSDNPYQISHEGTKRFFEGLYKERGERIKEHYDT